jgi:uncharacterized protein (UPF0548 family)
MPSLRKPSPGLIQTFLTRQAKLSFSYPAVGATATTPPPGYTVDHTRVRLGQGENVFTLATAALRRWDHFRLGWVEARSPDQQIAVGTPVAVLARVMGLWWLNACRVVYVVDESQGPIRRWGFAYGTLPGHAETGEERFQIEWDQADGSVYYDILAFSRPRHVLARLGYPLTRRFQRRFARDSAAAVAKAATAGRASKSPARPQQQPSDPATR